MKKEDEGLSLFEKGGTEVTLEEIRAEPLMTLSDGLTHQIEVQFRVLLKEFFL